MKLTPERWQHVSARMRPELSWIGLSGQLLPSRNRLVFERWIHDPDIYLFKPTFTISGE